MASNDPILTPTTAPPPSHLVGWDFPPLPRDPYIRVCQELSFHKEGWNIVPEWHYMRINPPELYVIPGALSWAELGAKLGNKPSITKEADQYSTFGGGGGSTRGRGGFGGSGSRGGGDMGRGSGGGPVPPGVCRDFFQTGSCRFANNCKFNHPAEQSGPPQGGGQAQRRDSVQSTQSGAPLGGPPPVNRSTAPKQTQYSHQDGSAPPSRGGGAGNRGRGDLTIRNDSGRGGRGGGGRGGNAGGAGGRGGSSAEGGGGFKLGARPPSPPPPAARADGKVWEGRGGARGGADRGRGSRGRGRGGRGGQGQGTA